MVAGSHIGIVSGSQSPQSNITIVEFSKSLNLSGSECAVNERAYSVITSQNNTIDLTNLECLYSLFANFKLGIRAAAIGINSNEILYNDSINDVWLTLAFSFNAMPSNNAQIMRFETTTQNLTNYNYMQLFYINGTVVVYNVAKVNGVEMVNLPITLVSTVIANNIYVIACKFRNIPNGTRSAYITSSSSTIQSNNSASSHTMPILGYNRSKIVLFSDEFVINTVLHEIQIGISNSLIVSTVEALRVKYSNTDRKLLHFDASYLNVTDNTSLTSWPSLVNNVSLVPTGNCVYKSVSFSGRPSIYLDGSSYLTLRTYSGILSYPTIVSVVQHSGEVPIWDLSITTDYNKLFPNYLGTMYITNSQNTWSTHSGLPNNQRYIIIARYNTNNTYSLFINDGNTTTQLSGTYTEPLQFRGLQLGVRTTNVPVEPALNGYLQEVQLYNYPINDFQIARDLNALIEKWFSVPPVYNYSANIYDSLIAGTTTNTTIPDDTPIFRWESLHNMEDYSRTLLNLYTDNFMKFFSIRNKNALKFSQSACITPGQANLNYPNMTLVICFSYFSDNGTLLDLFGSELTIYGKIKIQNNVLIVPNGNTSLYSAMALVQNNPYVLVLRYSGSNLYIYKLDSAVEILNTSFTALNNLQGINLGGYTGMFLDCYVHAVQLYDYAKTDDAIFHLANELKNKFF